MRLILKELSRYKIGTFANIIYRNALLYPEKEAFICGAERITFAEYNARANSLIHALHSMGVNRGDVIGVLSGTCLECYEVFGAAQKGGFILSPFNIRLQLDELNNLINVSEANTLFVGPEFVEMANSLRGDLPKVKNFIPFGASTFNTTGYHDLLAAYPTEEPNVQVEEDDLLYIIYTGGTTGLPRGALWSHRRALIDCRYMISVLGLSPTDRFLFFLPFSHIGGVGNTYDYFYIGATNVIMESKSFDPAVTLQVIQDEKITSMVLVPTHLIAMLNLPDIHKYDLSSLKRVLYVGSPMPLEVLEKAIKQLGHIFIQAYGLTEGGRCCILLRPEDHKVKDSVQECKVLTSAGRPDMETHVRIVDDRGNDVQSGESGEIIIESKHTMVEYWHNPGETQKKIEDGWLHTGDIGRYDDEGYIYIVDRKNDMIISGGENIFPREVEDVLYKHPSVMEAVVIGVPHPYWVEKVHAVVTLKEGHHVTGEELIAFCRNHIAHYKAPKSIEFVHSLPKTAIGKISRKQLREKYW